MLSVEYRNLKLIHLFLVNVGGLLRSTYEESAHGIPPSLFVVAYRMGSY